MPIGDIFNHLAARLLDWQRLYTKSNSQFHIQSRQMERQRARFIGTLSTFLPAIVADPQGMAALDAAFCTGGVAGLVPSAVYARSQPQRDIVRAIETNILAHYKDLTSMDEVYKRLKYRRNYMQTLIRYRANQAKEAACSAPCAADNGPESPRGLLAGADRLYGHEKQEIERLEASLALYEREQATCVTPDIFARALAKVLPDHAGNGPFMGALVALLPEPARADFAACAQSVGELQRAVADIRDIGHEINSITNAARPVEDFLRAKLTIHKLDTATPADAVLDALQIEKVAVFNARDIHAFSARVAALTPNACA